MKTIYRHLKTYVVRGLLAIIPLGLAFLVLRFLYIHIDRQIMGMIDELIGYSIPGLGLFFLAVLLYILGLIASNVIGKRLFELVDFITVRIPVVKTFYQAGKQIAGAFTLPDTSAFQRPVFIEYLSPGQWTIGFVTGTMTDEKTGERLYRVYVPTPPIPTSGIMIIVRESKVRHTGMTVEEAMKIIMSAGIIGPDFAA